ncbi:hypothetical protein [Micromonospora sp. NBC_01813]|uniref:hypothetical protein n=1 Tax=Micromonospora sp. NBC_01813 TaxID=2975988 RepID=UPI002DD9BE46|nr:hypothetical protein [Micromonospora sp. NBC_01813]WSA11537.1 hypothetical protein OG958_12565 [Micromonospora sp. NBC_01813]
MIRFRITDASGEWLLAPDCVADAIGRRILGYMAQSHSGKDPMMTPLTDRQRRRLNKKLRRLAGSDDVMVDMMLDLTRPVASAAR